jgi:hypothetical protein
MIRRAVTRSALIAGVLSAGVHSSTAEQGTLFLGSAGATLCEKWSVARRDAHMVLSVGLEGWALGLEPMSTPVCVGFWRARRRLTCLCG